MLHSSNIPNHLISISTQNLMALGDLPEKIVFFRVWQMGKNFWPEKNYGGIKKISWLVCNTKSDKNSDQQTIETTGNILRLEQNKVL